MTPTPQSRAKPGLVPSSALLPVIAGLAAYGTVLAKGRQAVADPDIYLHIVAGRWILAHGAVPHQDPFSNSMMGAPWVAHEWFAEVITALSYDAFGWTGLIAGAALLFGVAIALLARALQHYLEPPYVAIGCVLAWGLCFPHLVMRPHLFSLPLLVMWTAPMVAARQKNRAPHPLLALLMAPWANLHGEFMAGLLIAAFFFAEALIEADGKKSLKAAVKGWGLFSVLSLLAALMTPNGVAGLVFPFTLLRMDYALSWVNEWQSPNFQTLQPIEPWIMLVLLGALCGGFRLPVTRIVLLLGLLHAALQHQRQGEILGLISPLLVAPALGPQLPGTGRFATLGRLGERRSAVAAILGAALVVSVAAMFAIGRIDARADRYTPSAAVAAAQKAGLRGNVLNAYGFGGYLIFSNIAPFIDGRVDMYGDDFLRRYDDTEHLSDVLARYRIGWTLLRPGDSRIAVLDHMEGWRRFYADKEAVIHVRAD